MPVIVGALISIVPNMINKKIDNKNKLKEDNRNIKLQNYVELIDLLTIVLKNPGVNFEQIISKINIVNMIGSVEVVYTLNEYIQTWWGFASQEDQNTKYFQLLIAMRKDIGIDEGDLSKLSTIGLLDIQRVSWYYRDVFSYLSLCTN